MKMILILLALMSVPLISISGCIDRMGILSCDGQVVMVKVTSEGNKPDHVKAEYTDSEGVSHVQECITYTVNNS